MAHVREKSYKPSSTISFDPKTLSRVEDYRFEKRKDNRSQAIDEILRYGFKYLKLIEKQKLKKSERVTG